MPIDAKASCADPTRAWSSAACGRFLRMNLTIWLPVLFVAGIAAMGLMFAFAAGCQRV
jgi:hypothetical protein